MSGGIPCASQFLEHHLRGLDAALGDGVRAADTAGSARDTVRPGLGSPLPHLRRDWAHPCHIRTRTGLTPCHIGTGTGLAVATSAPGSGSPFHIGTGTGSAPATSAPGLGSPPATSAPGLGSPPCDVCSGNSLLPSKHSPRYAHVAFAPPPCCMFQRDASHASRWHVLRVTHVSVARTLATCAIDRRLSAATGSWRPTRSMRACARRSTHRRQRYPFGMVSHLARYHALHGIPPGMVSHPVWYPPQHGIARCMAAEHSYHSMHRSQSSGYHRLEPPWNRRGTRWNRPGTQNIGRTMAVATCCSVLHPGQVGMTGFHLCNFFDGSWRPEVRMPSAGPTYAECRPHLRRVPAPLTPSAGPTYAECRPHLRRVPARIHTCNAYQAARQADGLRGSHTRLRAPPGWFCCVCLFKRRCSTRLGQVLHQREGVALKEQFWSDR
jgi:hypothetical protein